MSQSFDFIDLLNSAIKCRYASLGQLKNSYIGYEIIYFYAFFIYNANAFERKCVPVCTCMNDAHEFLTETL